ncbi:MAG: extracellular solute-binding protein [Lachnospiraceae bacterium]|nr:extracellular solute-binding protein [Lachnospiraceae bacterium]
MPGKRKKVILILVIVIALIAAFIVYRKLNQVDDYHDKYAGYDLDSDVQGVSRDSTYAKYLQKYGDAGKPANSVEVGLFDFTDGEGVRVETDYEGEPKVIYMEDDSRATWQVEIPQSGLYNMYIEYYPIASRGVDIERAFYINGSLPFAGSDDLAFSRVWGDKNEVREDNQGNEIRPTQVEIPRWQSSFFKDYMGYYTEPYQYYFEAGSNEITLEAVNEPMVIRRLVVMAIDEQLDYADYIAAADKNTYKNTDTDFEQKVQGEDSTFRSSPSLYATYDRSSATTEPYSSAKIKLNMIGGQSWKVSGQWIEWDITVPEDGFYEISIKGRQNYQRGFVSNRALFIDGKVPFKEVSAIPFQYNNAWDMLTLSDEDGNPYQFALTAGTHTIRLEVTLGDLGGILNEMEDSVYRLNQMYRKILVLTGTEPDEFRDYQLGKVYPEVIEAMGLESKRLYRMVDEIVAYTGQKASQIAAAQTLATQLERFVKNPDKIPPTMMNFKENISSLGTSIQTLSEAPLDIDYIVVAASGHAVTAKKETFLKKAVHEIRSFVSSFTEDYNSLGNIYDKDEAITVWMLSGRDQSTILKTMIDDTFTPQYGIGVNVKLVEAGTLLPATVAGTGPDVALSVGQGEPVNYALRNASVDLSKFDGIDEVLSHYYPSAYAPYQFNGGIYGLPETQNYNVLFYRTDIMEELGLEIPQTWDDFINMLPIIQQNNMSAGIPSVYNNANAPDLSSLLDLLFQNGGVLYNGTGESTQIDEEPGVNAFEMHTRFFTHYKLPTIYNFVNRFRSGEMPIGISSYSTYNTLVVFAPEIRGLWDFTMIPGIQKEDGTIDRSAHSWGNCSMMLQGAGDEEKAWQFMKWWADAETQTRFGRELESVMGSSARYATANVDAFEGLAWSSKQMKVLKEQWAWTCGTPEVPGSYYTSRHLVNAVRKVIAASEDPRETLLDYTRTINEELTKKRKEFGLSIEQDQ